jgi:dolichol-phosphate mannosyltransferase
MIISNNIDLIMRICIIIPAYNEEDILKESLETILKYTTNLKHIVDVLVVNDGSYDSSKFIVEQIASKENTGKMHLISHQLNKGYGAALNTGINYALSHKYDYMLFMDSDLTNHPKYINAFIDKMCDGYDYIKATRYGKGGSVSGVTWKRRSFSIVGNYIARYLYKLPLTDLTNGFRAVSSDILNQMDLKESGYGIIMEELYYAKFITTSFSEVPYEITARLSDQGESKFTYNISTYITYLNYSFRSYFKHIYKQCHKYIS